jgi:hypothetical protein
MRTRVPEYDEVPPNAPSLVNSMCASGYYMESAVADIIDNSISAKASSVRIIVNEDGASSWIAIADNGWGMDDATLRNAMTFGCIDPEAPRDPDDLGRFGLGLKTASLSQCRRLTVLTRRRGGKVLVRCWDKDVIKSEGRWALLRKGMSPHLEERFRNHLQAQESGTVVLWEVLDRLGHDSRESDIAERLKREIIRLEEHLSMVFHRILEEPGGFRILIGEIPVEPWDPFMRGEKATQMLGEEELEHGGHRVVVRPYVLPHISKLSAEAHRRGAGPRKWSDHQGFYVYRNRRLLVPGSWLRLGFAKEEHNKLARIQLDFPNELDFAWDINVRKSRAVPPDALRDDLIRIARKTRDVARGIYRHRGATIARQHTEQVFMWEKKVKHNKVFYRLNAAHPAVASLMDTARKHGIGQEVGNFLRLIEETIPVPLILIDGSENPDKFGDQKKAPSEMHEVFRSLHAVLCAGGATSEVAFEQLAATEPFHRYPELLAVFKERERIGDS